MPQSSGSIASKWALGEKLSFRWTGEPDYFDAVSSAAQDYLGIEGGGTKTISITATSTGELKGRVELGPGNIRLLSDQELGELFSQIARVCPRPKAIGIGMAGMRDETDRRRIESAVARTWGDVPAAITNDLEIALAAADTKIRTKVLVLSGTGSCCFGKSTRRTSKVGGWGHLIGDRGSGYDIGISALRELVYQFDRKQKWGALGNETLRALLLNEPNDLIAWVQSASKAEVAALAPVVFATKQDSMSREVLAQAADTLARDAAICAARLASKGEAVAFVLAGSVLLKQPAFTKKVGSKIQKAFPKAEVFALAREAAWGAVELARGVAERKASHQESEAKSTGSACYVPEFRPADSPTEQRNPNSMRFHEYSTARMVEVMLDAESEVIPALRKERKAIQCAVDAAAATLNAGGRIFYLGAGTSGRLGILDASECPPTFRASPEMIQGIIAGGQRAIWQAVEGAEDSTEAGVRALRFRNLTRRDLVVGIAASGRTPFVWGGLGFAREVGAKTVLLSCNPSLHIEKQFRPDVVIAPNLGPEVLTGSTRLKSGTATKIVLNMISTIAMVRLGKVIGNLMVDLNPSNVKLRDRAIRILRELTGCTPESAKDALEKNGWVVKDAWSDLQSKRSR